MPIGQYSSKTCISGHFNKHHHEKCDDDKQNGTLVQLAEETHQKHTKHETDKYFNE